MQFGVCGDFATAQAAADAAYDYAEWSVPNLLKPQESDDVFQAVLAEIRSAQLPYPVANGFVPGELKITGPDADLSVLQTFVTTAMQRAEVVGIDTIVFGSGGARQVPDGFDKQKATEQIIAFCQMVGPIAQRHGVTVAVEHLNESECNILNTLDECAAVVRAVDHPNIRLLVDGYHLMHDNGSYESIVEHGDLLTHAHIATVPNRKAPAAEACDFTAFFSALKRANYNGRISIEGKIPDPKTDLPLALALMRTLTQ
jgi:sugar phosphate isomerase/epimerase